MSEGSKIGRVIKDKYRDLIVNHFANTNNYSVTEGCKFDDNLYKLCEAIAPIFKDVMTIGDVHEVMFDALRDYHIPPNFIIEGVSFGKLPDPAVVVEQIVNRFSRYPRAYTCEITLPNFLVSGFTGEVISLAEGIEIRLPMADEHKASLFLKGTGYFGRGSKSPYVSYIVATLKIFLFILQKFNAPDYYAYGGAVLAVVYDDNASLSVKLNLPTDLNGLLNSATIIIPIMRKITNFKYVKSDDYVFEVKETLIGEMMVIDHLRRRENARIVAAIEWYIDSLSVENQTVAVLEVCIGLEAILGEEADMSEMSKRLCDRLAFTLGKTRPEREIYHAEYASLLKLRGRLVHAKIFRLNEADESVLERGRALLRKIIDHELQYLK